MSIRNQNWYNLQSTRRYPLDDASTGDDDRGVTLRDDILVDCNIRFPSTLGRYLYVQALTVSPGLVTVVFGVGRQLFSRDGVTVAAVSLTRPLTTNINYSVLPLTPGVAGWVTFGPGATTTYFSARYTTPKQSLISARCGRAYSALPIQTLAKLGLRDTLDKIVNITVTTPLVAKYVDDAGDYIDPITNSTGTVRKAIVIGLDQSLVTETFNPLKDFVGPCAQRPESGTCEQEPIESINGVQPDCDGNIEIIFDTVSGLLFNDCGGIDLVTDVSLQESCSNIPDPKKEFIDLCCAIENENGELVPDEFCWPDPVPDIEIEDIINPNQPCAEFPICLNSCDATAYFNITSGAFLSTTTLAPPPNASGIITESDLTQHYTLASTPTGASAALLKNCATDWAANKTTRTTLKLSAIGVEKNGGVLLNYRSRVENGRLIRNYVAVVIEAQTSQIKVLRFTGDAFVVEHTIPFVSRADRWYELRVTPIMNSATSATLNIVAVDMLTGFAAGGAATVAEYGTPTGYLGIFAQRSYTFFNSFDVL
jgi:hypothetical protein